MTAGASSKPTKWVRSPHLESATAHRPSWAVRPILALLRGYKRVISPCLPPLCRYYPSCSQYSAATCCCECNLTRATWGLTKHLIVEGADADRIRSAVKQWQGVINPDGFSGSSCFDGGCQRTFRNNGCGGMSKAQLLY